MVIDLNYTHKIPTYKDVLSHSHLSHLRVIQDNHTTQMTKLICFANA